MEPQPSRRSAALTRTALATALTLLTSAVAQDLKRTPQTLAAGTAWATEAVTIDSGREGPTVLVVGGIHGDQPASFRAARQIAAWSPARGRLVVLAAANPTALAAGSRGTPGLAEERSDLNRQFGGADGPADGPAAAIWDFVVRLRPDLTIALHEGSGGGGSLSHDAADRELVQRILAVVEAEPEGAAEAGVPGLNARAGLPEGSLCAAVREQLGRPALSLVGPREGKLAVRTRALRNGVHAALRAVEAIEHGPERLLPERRGERLRIALFDDAGAAGKGPGRLEELLDERHGYALRRVSGADVRERALAQFDVAIFPGGTGSGQGGALGAAGREAVRAFVRDGGGYVGICAGAYLAANNYSWSLKILDADVIDRAHWKRGRGPVELEWEARTRADLKAPIRAEVLYVNGPLYAPAGDEALPDFEVLAWFRGEIRENDAPVGVMRDSPAMVRGRYGRGTVICSSPHPEQTEGLDELVRRLVDAAAGHRRR
jgi:glutamine amidotransferase-like uncharacterized protein/predicted deacylase